MGRRPPTPRHNAQESGDRAALPSPPDLAPTGADGVFVLNNGVSTFNLIRPPTEKKTEGLQYQQAPNVPRKKLCFVSRVSCLLKRRLAGLGVALVGVAVRAVDAGKHPEGTRALPGGRH